MQLRSILLTCSIACTSLAVALPNDLQLSFSELGQGVYPKQRPPVAAQKRPEPHNWQIAKPEEIPFPLYPNGQRYRIGGENGMKIVLFETSDKFSEVDAFYGALAANQGLSRKLLTGDYVQYADAEKIEPDLLHTTPAQPGIVIHEFADQHEAELLGAAPQSKTNIIISFR